MNEIFLFQLVNIKLEIILIQREKQKRFQLREREREGRVPALESQASTFWCKKSFCKKYLTDQFSKTKKGHGCTTCKVVGRESPSFTTSFSFFLLPSEGGNREDDRQISQVSFPSCSWLLGTWVPCICLTFQTRDCFSFFYSLLGMDTCTISFRGQIYDKDSNTYSINVNSFVSWCVMFV